MSNLRGIHRREFLRVGAAGFAGISLTNLLRAEQSADGRPASRAKALIFIYLAGGPSHLETFDPKPLAPMRIRGPWGAIATQVSGISFGEMLPQLAARNNRFALLRALNHANSLHNPWPVMTGNIQQRTTLTAAAAFLNRENVHELPAFVNLGPKLSIGAGILGATHEPLEVVDPTRAERSLADFTLKQDVDSDRLGHRERLLQSIDRLRRRADLAASVQSHDEMHQRALNLLTSNRVRGAFDLGQEPDERRDRFGANSFGQSCLLARRLIEAGTRCVQINWYNREDGFAVGWDVHGDDQTGLVRMEQQLCPRFDQGMSALIDDLDERGLLDSTLVIATGEFGRTPRISKLGGRDHWPYCFSALIAGGGAPGGRVVGASDAQGAYPADRPARPADLAATAFQLLGVNPNQDDRLRPMVFEGHAIEELCG